MAETEELSGAITKLEQQVKEFIRIGDTTKTVECQRKIIQYKMALAKKQ
ncbi:hypothetical protein LFYK43_09610 [Ligilactobacillus salitolerans]|uniref:Uncharacterized protein n=1 Tax=Ligilactobacillus salitolerans TaxID=1808352 RepID=A0A401ISI4_9LACO|nr:hypothetical protein [Ligilactobacillus salitolerans]GBG94502.1 hypothetical protein LFYK43_09610 [Ligilactobacillus salitolerans]